MSDLCTYVGAAIGRPRGTPRVFASDCGEYGKWYRADERCSPLQQKSKQGTKYGVEGGSLDAPPVGDGFPVPAVEQGDFASVSAHS